MKIRYTALILASGVIAVLLLSTPAVGHDHPGEDPCQYPITPECDDWEYFKNLNSTELNTSTDPNTVETRTFGAPCRSPVTPDCPSWEQKNASSNYVLDTDTDPKTLEYYPDGICEVRGFENVMEKLINTIYVGFFPVAVAGLLGERLTAALPWLSQQRRRKFMRWRGRVISAGAAMYILMPIGVKLALASGFPTPECITFIPY